MALFKLMNIRIAGISAGVPKSTVVNDDVPSKDYSAEDYIKTTGVFQKRIGDFTAADLGYHAAEKLIEDLQWSKDEIAAIIFVSQYADYILPATACVLQERLGLSRECYAADISLGCSGWVYGLNIISSVMQNLHHTVTANKALLIVGDAKKRAKSSTDDPLFGNAGTVTAIEYLENYNASMHFHFGTDGSGFDAIIIPGGGARNQFTDESLLMKEGNDGVLRHDLQTRMKGMDVFSFAISTAPKSVKKVLEFTGGLQLDDIDFFVFHQANLMINEKIRKKLKLPQEKVPYSLHDFGNTSSGSIPLTIVAHRDNFNYQKNNILACGFGVGLSWGSVVFNTDDKFIVSELVEVE